MHATRRPLLLTASLCGALLLGAIACDRNRKDDPDEVEPPTDSTPDLATPPSKEVDQGVISGTNPDLPEPYATKSVARRSRTVDWPENAGPTVPQGFEVLSFATDLDSPRQALVLENGDVLVAESSTGRSADRITLLRDADGDGKAEHRAALLEDLKQPFGMAQLEGSLYVANIDGLYRFPFTPGQEKIEAKGEKLMELPAGGYNNHWTRNLLLSKDKKTIFVSVGSASNVGEHGMEEEEGRAAIHAFDLASGKARLYASGLRNPVGMDQAEDGTLWTAVNERDELGDELVPDYVTHVEEGGFYGWPYSYYGQHVDPRREGEAPELVAKALVPDMAVGSHTAALGFLFSDQQTWPEAWRGGAFVARHGSWNRSELVGYDVIYLPFDGKKPTGATQPFLSGLIADAEESEVYGRPVSLQFTTRGELLVMDDGGDRIWLVRPTK